MDGSSGFAAASIERCCVLYAVVVGGLSSSPPITSLTTMTSTDSTNEYEYKYSPKITPTSAAGSRILFQKVRVRLLDVCHAYVLSWHILKFTR